MRTTIDLPEELLQRAKAIAAQRGISTTDFVTEILQAGLDYAMRRETGTNGRGPVPEMIPATGRQISFMSQADLLANIDEEEDLDQPSQP